MPTRRGSHLTLRFAHPEVDGSGGVISIRLDGVIKTSAGEAKSIGGVMDDFRSQYGVPTKVESSERPAMGHIDAPIPNRASYQIHRSVVRHEL